MTKYDRRNSYNWDIKARLQEAGSDCPYTSGVNEPMDHEKYSRLHRMLNRMNHGDTKDSSQ